VYWFGCREAARKFNFCSIGIIDLAGISPQIFDSKGPISQNIDKQRVTGDAWDLVSAESARFTGCFAQSPDFK
jgi:hypothetical protein